MCCTKWSSAINLDLFWKQVFYYIYQIRYSVCPITLFQLSIIFANYLKNDRRVPNSDKVSNERKKRSFTITTPGTIFNNTSFSSKLAKGPNKLVLHYNKLDRLAGGKQSSFMGPFVSYEEKEVLWIRSQKLLLNVKSLQVIFSSTSCIL